MLKAMLATQLHPGRRASADMPAKAGAAAREAPVHMAYFLCYPSMVKEATGRDWNALEGEVLASLR